MYQHARAFAAFVLAPPLTVAIFLSPVFGSILLSDDPFTGGFASTMPLFFIGCALAWTFAIVLGLPAYVLLRWLDIASPWVTIAVAAAIGASFNLASGFWPGNEGTSTSVNGCDVIVAGVRTACGYWDLAKNMMLSGAIGAIGGLIFWLIYADGWKAPSRKS
ncbi:hypothetical protein G6N74_29900 [Mesorhizobium sp. CGMCC 1.15528]|uniref:Uncharacterized protein n=1 Tax=Mesorhizobium zhangyense TaxID=1776730 RepID=A0A7C9VG11_9HYPH|nr:hypothetical protein [Mesorhizobium zhangyense]NGN45267.1 hypothetical protein [Mesorhizobium zhangyense]